MQFVIIARDGTDKDALARRMNARAPHIDAFKQGLDSGQNIVGGALLDEHDSMCGSFMVVEFENRKALDAWLENDPYVTGNVWQDIEILPIRLAGKA